MLTDQQIKLRKEGIGGSDAAAIVGASRYATPYDVYCEKIDPTLGSSDTPEKLRGKILEPLICQLYEITTNHQVKLIKETLYHEKHNFIFGHVDGFVKSENILLECKTAKSFQSKNWGQEESDDIPLIYRIQCAHYLSLMPAKRVDIALLMASEDLLGYWAKYIHTIDPSTVLPYLRVYHYYPSSIIETKLVDREVEFWNDHVLKRIPPDPQTEGDILGMFPNTNNSTFVASETDLSLIHHMKELKCSIKKYEDEYTSLKTKICAQMGLSSLLVDTAGERLLTWKNQKTTRFDTGSFGKEHPDLYQQFCKESETRVLRLN